MAPERSGVAVPPSTLYTPQFYADRHAQTAHAARTVLGLVLEEFPAVTSAVDVGCGVGTWLRVLCERGIDDVRGVDGPWVDQRYLEIPVGTFVSRDLARAGFDAPDRRFDLSICMEVAEHFDPARAGELVQYLVSQSDIVLFSAAIPGQGGIGHVNEQWPQYWVSRFAEHGFRLRDTLRPAIWLDESIPWWYRQNALLFVGPGVTAPASTRADMAGAPAVHPVLLAIATDVYVGKAFKLLLTSLGRAIRRRLQ